MDETVEPNNSYTRVQAYTTSSSTTTSRKSRSLGGGGGSSGKITFVNKKFKHTLTTNEQKRTQEDVGESVDNKCKSLVDDCVPPNVKRQLLMADLVQVVQADAIRANDDEYALTYNVHNMVAKNPSLLSNRHIVQAYIDEVVVNLRRSIAQLKK